MFAARPAVISLMASEQETHPSKLIQSCRKTSELIPSLNKRPNIAQW